MVKHMYSDGDFDKQFITEIVKLNLLHKTGLARKVIISELKEILDGRYQGSYIESKKIHLAENEYYLAELVLIRKSDLIRDAYLHSLPFDLCIIPVAGNFEIICYEVDEKLDIKKSDILNKSEDIYLFGKTSNTKKFYTANPTGESCLFITASSKVDCDEYYAIYEKDTNIKTLVSYNLQESRAQMWMEHYQDFLQAIPKELIEKLAIESKTRKFTEYLNGVAKS